MPRLPILLLVAAFVCPGCATGPNPRDPYEGFNRKVHSFNEGLDKTVLKPVAIAYDKVLPRLARTGVTNFFDNLAVIVTGVNDLAQLKLEAAVQDAARFSFNAVFGLGGLIDVASEMKVERHNEDLGQTLGYWGVGSGPYLVLPFFGPSNPRDAIALPGDYFVSPVFDWVDEPRVTNSLIALNVVNTRANLFDSEKFLEQAAIDKYAFLRDAYLQRREYLIRDGKAPSATSGARQKTLKELEEEDFGDEPPAPSRSPQEEK